MSDILIRGMEMPTEEEISKCIIIRHDGEVWIGEFDNLVDGGFVACYPTNPMRAVPLPEGHGDLIDRDALRAENGLNAKCEHCPTNTYECRNDMIYTKMDFCEMLDDATVIVPAEGGGEDG